MQGVGSNQATVSVEGCRLAYGVAGSDGPWIVLVHGAGGHQWWWHLVAGELSVDHRVVTLDLSGHGDSGRRGSYGPRVFASDVLGVIDAAVDGPCTLVGHSMGGLAATVAAARAPDRIASLVLLDTIFRPVSRRRNRAWPVGPATTYPQAAEARAHFSLVPRQPPLPAEVMDPVVGHSLRESEDGWTWKFDPRARVVFEDDHVSQQLARVTCPITYAYGTRGALRNLDAVAEVIRLRPAARVIAVEGGYHHLPLDSVPECVDLIGEEARRVASRAVPDPAHE